MRGVQRQGRKGMQTLKAGQGRREERQVLQEIFGMEEFAGEKETWCRVQQESDEVKNTLTRLSLSWFDSGIAATTLCGGTWTVAPGRRKQLRYRGS